MSPKVVVIGLDGLVPEIVFGPQGQQLGCLRRLMSSGRWGPLTSTHPPISVPAWVSAFTGLDPGELGIYGFRNLRPGSYRMELATGHQLRHKWVWEIAADEGLSSVVMGVPLTYPPRPTRGVVVSGIPVPPHAGPITRPQALWPRIKRAGYIVDMEGFRHMSPPEVLARAAEMASTRFQIWTGLISEWKPALAVVVEMAPDRVHHCLWAHHDPLHSLHDPSSPWREAVIEHYKLLDRLVEQVVEKLEPGTWVVVMSDHGAQRLTGALAINEWLASKGLLALRSRPSEPQPLSPQIVDWSHTKVWAEGGYYARIFLNATERQPMGTLEPHEAHQLMQTLARELEAMRGLDGKLLGNQVLMPQQLYRQLRGQPPELMLYPAGLKMRALSTIWPEPPRDFILPPGTSGLDQANHSLQGVLIVTRKNQPLPQAGQQLPPCHIQALAPTLLKMLELRPPEWMPSPWMCL